MANKLSFTTCSRDPFQRREAIVGIYHDVSKISFNKQRLNDIIKYNPKDTTFIFDEVDNTYILKEEKNDYILELEEKKFDNYTLDNLKHLLENEANNSNMYISFLRDINKNFISLNLDNLSKMYSSASSYTKKVIGRQYVTSWCKNAQMTGFNITDEQIDYLVKYIEEVELNDAIVNVVFSKNNKNPLRNSFSFINKFRSDNSIMLIYSALQQRGLNSSDYAYFITSDKWDKNISNVKVKEKYLELFYLNNKNDSAKVNEFLDCITNEKLYCEISSNEMTKLFMSLESDSDKKNMLKHNLYNTQFEEEGNCFVDKSNFFSQVKNKKDERGEYVDYLSKKVTEEYAKFLYLTSLEIKEQSRIDVEEAFIFDVDSNILLLKKYRGNLSQLDLNKVEKKILEKACENLYQINDKSSKDLFKILEKHSNLLSNIQDLVFVISSYKKKHYQSVLLSENNKSFFIHLFLKNRIFAIDKNLDFSRDIYASYGVSGLIEAIELCSINCTKGGLKKKLDKYAKKLVNSDFIKEKKDTIKLNLVLEKFFNL